MQIGLLDAICMRQYLPEDLGSSKQTYGLFRPVCSWSRLIHCTLWRIPSAFRSRAHVIRPMDHETTHMHELIEGIFQFYRLVRSIVYPVGPSHWSVAFWWIFRIRSNDVIIARAFAAWKPRASNVLDRNVVLLFGALFLGDLGRPKGIASCLLLILWPSYRIL